MMVVVCTVALTTGTPAFAQDAEDTYIDEIVTIGSRSTKPRSIRDSPVPVDVISADDLTAMGGTVDLTDNLKNLIPSYTATPATGDTSAFVRPTSLRGTAPDQTLVLVDGKRRHRSSVVQFFAPAAGNGSQGADIGMIPSIALKRVEVLRDGAASQYGSDAIAGVINFVTKDNSEGGTYQFQYGQHYQGEQSYKLGMNQGFSLGDKGFISISAEYSDNEALSRGQQRPDAQALIDAGVQGVGSDAPFGDAPLVQTWGRPETNALRLFVNAGIDINENTSLYARAGYGDTFGRYRFFYRRPGDDDDAAALEALVGLGYTGPLAQRGYTPFLDGNQKDYSLATGIKGDLSNGTVYDFSFSYGRNEMSLFLNNEIN
ncbi:TonB-dependent receptor, partial [hydrothermal vent metagenome]